MITTRATLDRQIASLYTRIAQLGETVEQSIGFSVKALRKHDLQLAHLIDNFDAQVNTRRFEIEERAYELLALQQPNCTDMRAVVAAVSVVTNLERIGDHAAGIARLALRVGDQPAFEPPTEFERMAFLTGGMLKSVIDAFVGHDDVLAHSIIERDLEIDDLHRSVYRKLISAMTDDPARVEHDTMMLWVSHNLERIGDRSVNIALRVTYLVTGELVRHVDPVP